MKKCHFCSENIENQMKVCPWCGRQQYDDSSDDTKPTKPVPLYFPPISNTLIWIGWIWVIFGVIGSIAVCPPIVFIPIGMVLITEGKKTSKYLQEQRQLARNATHSVLMSRANYVGGHPLIPQTAEVVIGVSTTHFTVYSVNTSHRIARLESIALLDISKIGAGRPKTAREIYDEDRGYTIDVIEQSPYLSIILKLEGNLYAISFDSIESGTPQEWSNQMIALQHKLRKEQSSTC